MPREINTGRYGSAIRHHLSLRGDLGTQISPEIAAHLDLASDRAEWKFLMGERLGRITHSQIAVAAQNGFVGLRCSSPRTLIVVTYCRVYSPTGGATGGGFQLSLCGTTAIPTFTPGGVRTVLDSRFDDFVFSQNVTATPGSGTRAGVSGNVIDDTPPATMVEFFALPGQALAVLAAQAANTNAILVWNKTVNQDIAAVFGFYERDIEGSEFLAP